MVYSNPRDSPPAGLAMRPDNAAAQLADAQSGRKEAAEGVKRVSGDTPDPGRELRPCTPYVKIALVRHTVE